MPVEGLICVDLANCTSAGLAVLTNCNSTVVKNSLPGSAGVTVCTFLLQPVKNTKGTDITAKNKLSRVEKSGFILSVLIDTMWYFANTGARKMAVMVTVWHAPYRGRYYARKNGYTSFSWRYNIDDEVLGCGWSAQKPVNFKRRK